MCLWLVCVKYDVIIVHFMFEINFIVNCSFYNFIQFKGIIKLVVIETSFIPGLNLCFNKSFKSSFTALILYLT